MKRVFKIYEFHMYFSTGVLGLYTAVVASISSRENKQQISHFIALSIRSLSENKVSRLDMVSKGNLLLIYICNFHVLSNLLLIFICKLHWNLNTMFVC